MNKKLEVDVFLGFGGNIGDTKAIFQKAFRLIETLDQVAIIKMSPLYKTTPVSPIQQRDYLNAALHIRTSLAPLTLFQKIEKIEKVCGKRKKGTEAPRPLDIDLLFYGKQALYKQGLILPHPEWKNRLFVLIPLSDLTDTLDLPNLEKPFDLKKYIQTFPNSHKETVERI